MNVILLFEEDFISPGHVCLKDRRRDHLRDVLGSKVGDGLCVGLVNGRIGTGRVIRIDDDIELQVDFTDPVPAPLPLTLIIPMIRPLMFKRLLFHATTLGIKKIIVLNFSRVEKSLWKSNALDPEAMRQQLILGLEQAKDTILPQAWIRQQFKPFVQDELPALAKNTLNLVAHPGALATLSKKLSVPGAGITLIIGPEGGIMPFELEELRNLGFTPTDLGPRILRVDTVLPYVIGRLF